MFSESDEISEKSSCWQVFFSGFVKPEMIAVFLYFGFPSQQLVDNKAKGRILKLVSQENKTHQVFRKTNISYARTRTHTCAYQVLTNVRFLGRFDVLCSLVTPVLRFAFCLITSELSVNHDFILFNIVCKQFKDLFMLPLIKFIKEIILSNVIVWYFLLPVERSKRPLFVATTDWCLVFPICLFVLQNSRNDRSSIK